MSEICHGGKVRATASTLLLLLLINSPLFLTMNFTWHLLGKVPDAWSSRVIIHSFVALSKIMYGRTYRAIMHFFVALSKIMYSRTYQACCLHLLLWPDKSLCFFRRAWVFCLSPPVPVVYIPKVLPGIPRSR